MIGFAWLLKFVSCLSFKHVREFTSGAGLGSTSGGLIASSGGGQDSSAAPSTAGLFGASSGLFGAPPAASGLVSAPAAVVNVKEAGSEQAITLWVHVLSGQKVLRVTAEAF